jgi:O-antigen ligase
LRTIFFASIAAGAVACVDFVYQLPPVAGFAPQFVWLASGVFRRAQGLFYEASTLGNFCAFFLVMVAAALVHKVPISRWWLLAGTCVFAPALLFSYSRASVVTVVVAMAALCWLRRGALLSMRAWIAAVILSAAGTGALYLLRPEFVELYWTRLSGSAMFFFVYPEGILSGRVFSWQSLLEFAARNPLKVLWGVGYKTLPYTDWMGQPMVADNAYLSALIEMGIAGLAALVLGLLLLGWRVRADALRGSLDVLARVAALFLGHRHGGRRLT